MGTQQVQSAFTPAAAGAKVRGSKKLLDAWKARALTEAAVQEIAEELEKSPAVVEEVLVVGGTNATGIRLSLAYTGDDGPWCGNDIRAWLQWLHRHGGGGVVRPPKIIINGQPFPEFVRLQLDFGHVPEGVADLGTVRQEITAGQIGA